MSDLREALTSAFESTSTDDDSLGHTSEGTTQVEESTSIESSESVQETPVNRKNTPKSVAQEEEKGKAESPPTKEPESASNLQPKSKDIAAPAKDTSPASWKGEVKALWGTLPPQVQGEISRREREFQKYIQDTSVARTVHGQISQILEPHMENFSKANLHPFAVVNELLNQGRVLWTGSPADKAKMAAKIVQDCGIDLELLDQMLAQSINLKKDPVANNIQELLQRELAPIKQFMQQTQQPTSKQDSGADDAAIMSEIQEFASKHPHFESVREDMADILELASSRGLQMSFEDAYNRALSFYPELSSASTLRQGSKNVGHSVGGTPVVTTGSTDTSNLRGVLENAFNSVRI